MRVCVCVGMTYIVLSIRVHKVPVKISSGLFVSL